MAPIIGGPNGKERDIPGEVTIEPQSFCTIIKATGEIAGVLTKETDGKTPRQAGISYLKGSETGTVNGTKGEKIVLDSTSKIKVKTP